MTGVPSLALSVLNPITAVGGVSAPTSKANGEVVPSWAPAVVSVAVAVTNGAPTDGVGNVNEKLAFPEASVVTLPVPSK